MRPVLVLLAWAALAAHITCEARLSILTGVGHWLFSKKLPVPWPMQVIRPSFELYSRASPTPCDLTYETLVQAPSIVSALQACRTTPGVLDARASRVIFVVHGFTETINKTYLHDIKDAILEAEAATVVVTGWGGGADTGLDRYRQAAANTQTTGILLGEMSHALVELGFSRGQVYCVGHSLGAHVCGQAGKYGLFGRISGLDPAGPEFEGVNPAFRLHRNDASFVDVIHTDGLHGAGVVVDHLGTLDVWGDVDFYPNGGMEQPGCSRLAELDACSHQFSHLLYLDSILNTACAVYANCSDPHLLPESCSAAPPAGTGPVQMLGYHADRFWRPGMKHQPAQIFYLRTKGEPTYCNLSPR